MIRKVLALLFCGALVGQSAPALGQQPPSVDDGFAPGNTVTVDGTISSTGGSRDCWIFSAAGRTVVGVDEWPIFSVIDLPEDFRQPVQMRVTITGLVQSRSDGGCFPTRKIVVRSIETADGPQLREAVYARLREAQRCAEANDKACAAAILDEIESTYELNAYELWQLWNFRAFLYVGAGETSLGIHAIEEILTLGDITDWFAPEPWTTFILTSIRDERYSDALQIIDAVCSYRSCDELRGLRSEAVSATQATSP